ncbi:MAG: response regulator [Pseudomonadota bacterium]
MDEPKTERQSGRILVVDDTSANLQLLTNLLIEHGYTVHPASDGELALAFVRSTLPDLILLDIRMPGMDGFEVCRRLKADERTASIPIIFISILEDEHDKVKGLQAGAVDYITKPFQAEEVLARIGTHLHLRELTEHLEHMVAERTAELHAANAQLQRELAERKQAEAALRQSETLLNATQRLGKIGGWDWDVEQQTSFWTEETFRIHGFAPEVSAPGSSGYIDRSLTCYDPADRYIISEAFQRCVQQGDGYDLDFPFTSADGCRKWIRTTAAAVQEEGRIVKVIGNIMDITERKRVEEELARHRDHLEELVQMRTAELEQARNKARQYLDIAGVILVAIDADRRVTLINQKGCEVLQGTSAEIIGKDWFETFVPEQIRGEVIASFHRLMAGEIEPVEYYENPVLTIGGQERLVAWHNALLRDNNENITGTLSSGEDVTERKHTEEQIINLNRDLQKRAAALEAANKELEGFTYSVSHDLRAPLRHIDGFLGLLKKKAGTALDDQSRHYMDTISSAANKMGLLIDDLLSFSRMGRHAMSAQPVALEPLVHNVIRELEPDAAGRDIDWRIGDLPTVLGDAAMLRMVLENLITNALKFTRPRQQAQIEIGSLSGQDAETVIFVRDNGVGFLMAYADKLFGVFQRLHRTEEFEGTGIGLANVRRIIARHGGRTWAEGGPDLGATFYFSLPHT